MPGPHASPTHPELTDAKRALLESRLRGRSGRGAIPRVPREEAPLSFAQERLWFLERLQPGSAAYNIPAALRLSGPLDAPALERALARVVERHESLRTTFREVEGRPVQTIHPFAGIALPVVEIAGTDAATREAGARRLATEDADRPFDLVRGPLFRATLLRLEAEDHVLLLALHHAVADGWSMGILLRELSALYAALREGRTPELPELPVQYADFAVWQREQLGGSGMGAHLAWWRERLAGAPTLLELPTDHPRPAVQSYRGAHEPFRFEGALLSRLEALAEREGTTLYMLLLAAFQALLAEYAGTEDVVVGSPVAGRPRREVEGVIGLFVNTLVLRTDLSGDPTFRTLLRRVREGVLGALEHQAVPFERLVSELRPERSLSHSPLFQVFFSLNDGLDGGRGGGMDGLRIGEVEAELATTKFDLSLTVAAQDGALAGSVAYATDLFDRETAVRAIDHYRRLLEGVAAAPDAPLSALELAGPEERRRVLETWNATAAAHSAEPVHAAFAAQARRTPHAVALEHGATRLTYAALERRVSALAHRLRGAGVGPDRRVAVSLRRGPDLVVALLATLTAGGAYVPLDPAYPAERLRWMLTDSGAGVLLADDALSPELRAAAEAAGAAILGAGGEGEGAAAGKAPEAGAGPTNLAYVIYTSGSTGRPKGVAIPHASVSAFFGAMDGRLGAAPGVWLAVTSVSFDISVLELLWTLTRGYRVVLHDAVDGATCRRMRESGATHFQCTPSLAEAALREPDAASAFRGLRTMVVGGEALSGELANALRAAVGGRVLNLYGPTEATVWSTAWTVEAGRPVVIGRPLASYRAYLLDLRGRPRPQGLAGELHLGGDGMARGYLGRPALTAERFVPDPFAGVPGARMYRTGDRARWTSTGELDFLGRVDDQVKVRGYRIEPGEIESALRALPGVDACAVVAREDAPGNRRLVAYVVGDAEAGALREGLRRSLPDHMVPAAFVPLCALPRTPNGKLDRRALPAPEAPAGAGAVEEPRSFLEAQLVQLWEELLGVAPVGVTQGFFELGGDSLLALRLVSTVEARMGCEIPVSTLFAGATVREMAEAIRARNNLAPAPDAALVTLQPNGDAPPLFLIHPADRHVVGYVALVRHLGGEQPVYGLRDVARDPARPLTEIAAGYVAAIRAVQPHGPYRLAGWSFGGFVAYEMAVQFERAGERTEYVGLLDTMSPAMAQGWPWNTDADLVSALAADLAARAGRPLALPPEALRGLDFDAQVAAALAALDEAGALDEGFGEAQLRGQCELLRARVASLEGYVPGPFTGTLTLYRATEVPERQQAYFDTLDAAGRETLGWSAVAPGRVEVHAVPGTHATLGAEPHVRTLAPLVRRALARTG